MFVGAGDLRLATSKDLVSWSMHPEIVLRREDCPAFASHSIDSGPSPFMSQDGIIAILNATDSYKHGRVFAALFDSQNPTSCSDIHKNPILSAQADWEKFGYQPNVVKATSMIFTGQEFRLYYSGGDRSIGIATSPIPRNFRKTKTSSKSEVLAAKSKPKAHKARKSKKKTTDKICGV